MSYNIIIVPSRYGAPLAVLFSFLWPYMFVCVAVSYEVCIVVGLSILYAPEPSTGANDELFHTTIHDLEPTTPGSQGQQATFDASIRWWHLYTTHGTATNIATLGPPYRSSCTRLIRTPVTKLARVTIWLDCHGQVYSRRCYGIVDGSRGRWRWPQRP